MQVQNTTQNTYFLGRGEYQLNPGATITIPNDVYDVDDAVAQAVNELDEEGFANVSSTPVGYPREVYGDDDEGGGGDPGGGGDYDPSDTDTDWKTELFDTYA